MADLFKTLFFTHTCVSCLTLCSESRLFLRGNTATVNLVCLPKVRVLLALFPTHPCRGWWTLQSESWLLLRGSTQQPILCGLSLTSKGFKKTHWSIFCHWSSHHSFISFCFITIFIASCQIFTLCHFISFNSFILLS